MDFENKIAQIIKEPVHGKQFYTPEMFAELIDKVKYLKEKFEITSETSKDKIIDIIQNYVKSNVKIRSQYFDVFCERDDTLNLDELIYRTAYGATKTGEAMCAGYAELTRILLALYDIESYTVLAKLPGKNKRLVHYAVVAKYQDKDKIKYRVLDPERLANCEKKGMDYERYVENMTFSAPHPIFTRDVLGDTGLGLTAEEYFNNPNVISVNGTKEISKIINEIEKERIEKDGAR